MIDWVLVETSLSSAGAAFIFSLATYLSQTSEEKWSFIKAGKTTLLAAVLAFSMSYWGLTAATIYASPFYALAGIILEKVLKIIDRKILPKLKEVWEEYGYKR